MPSSPEFSAGGETAAYYGPDPIKRLSQMRLKRLSQMRLKKLSQMRLKKDLDDTTGTKRMSMMRLKKDPLDDEDEAGSSVDKRLSRMRLKKMTQMRIRRGPSMLRLRKKSDDGCVWIGGICFSVSDWSKNGMESLMMTPFPHSP